MTNHLNSAPFLYLHHRHCHSQDIGLLYPSPSGLSLKIKMSSNTHTPTHLIIHILHLNDTHLNSYTAPSWYSGNRTRASLDPPLETPFDSSQRSWISWCPGALGFWVVIRSFEITITMAYILAFGSLKCRVALVIASFLALSKVS